MAGPANRRAEAPRAIDAPEPGYFLLRVRPSNVWVPAQIMHEDGLWLASIDGVQIGLPQPELTLESRIFEIWTFGRPISITAYLQAMQDRMMTRPFGIPDTGQPSQWMHRFSLTRDAQQPAAHEQPAHDATME